MNGFIGVLILVIGGGILATYNENDFSDLSLVFIIISIALTIYMINFGFKLQNKKIEV